MLNLAVLCAVSSAIEFDTQDPLASHPEMQSLINGIVDRNARRGLTNPATLNQQDRDDILALHNKVRAETARGEYAGSGSLLPQSSNMNYLQWSSSLETVASDWSANCNFEHRSGSSSCANALSGMSVDFDGYAGNGCGENLYASGADPAWSVVYGTTDYGIKGGIHDGWCVNEAKTWTYSTSMGSAGHYTQVVWANTKYVGCGFYNCNNGWMKNIFTCNYYPPGNYGGQYPYQSGSTGSACSNGVSSNSHTAQDGETWDLSGLCLPEGGSTPVTDPTPNPTVKPATPSPVNSGGDSDGECLSISGLSNSNLNGQYVKENDLLWYDGTYYLERKTYGTTSYWGFYTTEGSPNWSMYGYCWGDDVTTCTWLSSAGSPTISYSTCNGNVSPVPAVTPAPVTNVNTDPCVVIENWDSTYYGGGFDAGQWEYVSDYEGNKAYKWSEGEYYLYTLSGYNWYTISQSIGGWSSLKGWCGSTYGDNIDVLDCDGVWYSASNVIFRDCNDAGFVFEPCLDDAADYVHFQLDADSLMSFELHSEMGCFNNEPVWKHTTSADEEWFLHFDSQYGVWTMTTEWVEGTAVYQCTGDDLAECVEGSWLELYTPDTADCTAVNATGTPCAATAVRELNAARVDLAFNEESNDDSQGLSGVAIGVIVVLVLILVAVAAVLLWKRNNRMKGQHGFEDKTDTVGINAADTAGDAVDVGTDEENEDPAV